MEKGFTLLEVTFAVGILAVAILGLVSALHSPYILNEVAKEGTVALKDSSRVMEAIRATDFSSIVTTDWTGWAQSNGLTHLSNEAVIVTATGTDPLTITVEVQWVGLGGRGSAQRLPLVTRRSL